MQMNEVASADLIAAAPPVAPIAVQELMAAVLSESRRRAIKQIMFVGANPKVGTTFLINHFANQMVPILGKVLIVEVRQEVPDAYAPLDPLAAHFVTRATMQPATCLAFVARGRSALPDEWLKEYGLILWDVPPISVIPVSIALASYVDGILFLAQAYGTRRHVATQAVKRLEESGGRVMGVALTNVKTYIPSWLYRFL
jgi:Mrp family chromosome partitioning ATPase